MAFEFTLITILSLFGCGIAAGAINAVAGGGTFVSFPVLILMGLPPVVANTTNKVALTFASLASVRAFRQEIAAHTDRKWPYFISAVAGSILGSVLLLFMDPDAFRAAVPWLMLAATCLFIIGGRASSTRRLRALTPFMSYAGQFMIGVYGGFFAAGMGMLMMALYSLSGISNIHQMNGLKTFAGLGINAVSALIFLTTGLIDARVALVLIAGALLGGYYGAALSRRVTQRVMRMCIIFYGMIMTGYFFVS